MPRTYGVPIKFGSRPPPLRATRCEPDYCVMYALTVRPNRPLAWSLQIPIIRDTWRDRPHRVRACGSERDLHGDARAAMARHTVALRRERLGDAEELVDLTETKAARASSCCRRC